MHRREAHHGEQQEVAQYHEHHVVRRVRRAAQPDADELPYQDARLLGAHGHRHDAHERGGGRFAVEGDERPHEDVEAGVADGDEQAREPLHVVRVQPDGHGQQAEHHEREACVEQQLHVARERGQAGYEEQQRHDAPQPHDVEHGARGGFGGGEYLEAAHEAERDAEGEYAQREAHVDAEQLHLGGTCGLELPLGYVDAVRLTALQPRIGHVERAGEQRQDGDEDSLGEGDEPLRQDVDDESERPGARDVRHSLRGSLRHANASPRHVEDGHGAARSERAGHGGHRRAEARSDEDGDVAGAAAVAVSFTLHTDEPPLRARAAHAANTATLAASMTMNEVWASSSAGPRLPSEGASAKYRESPNMARSIHDQKKLAPTMASHEEEPLKALKFIAPFLETRYAVGAIIARPPSDNEKLPPRQCMHDGGCVRGVVR